MEGVTEQDAEKNIHTQEGWRDGWLDKTAQ
jgi:hypothetical protein